MDERKRNVQIYLDAVWTLNILLDLMLLMLTRALAHDRTPFIRVLAGAFVASVIVPVTIYYPDSFLGTLLGKLLFSLCIMFSAFSFISVRRLFKQLLLFYFLTFSIGGTLTGLHFMMNQPFAITSGGVMTLSSGYGDPVSWLFIVLGFPFVWLFSKRRMEQHAGEKIRYDQIHRTMITIRGLSVSAAGYLDSGNQLSDPLTRYPVIVGDEALMKSWFTDEEWTSLKTACEQLDLSRLPEKWLDQIKMIPYQGVEGTSRFLFALRPESVTIQYEQHVITADQVYIGIQFGRMTDDGSYNCLLQPRLVQQAIVYTA